MKRNVLLSSALLIGISATIGAQQPPSSRPTSSMGTDDKRLTATGCLQTDESAGNGRFVLTNAREGSSPGGGSAVHSPTPPGSGSTETAARAGATQPAPVEGAGATSRLFVLHGQMQELALHAGQQVEISGMRMASSVATPGAAATTGTAGGRDNSDRVKPSRDDRPTFSNGAQTQEAQEIEVTSVRMIASTCAVP